MKINVFTKGIRNRGKFGHIVLLAQNRQCLGRLHHREPIFRHVTCHIGRFGLPLDSSTSTHVSAKHPLSSASSDYHSLPMSPSDMIYDSPVNVGRLIALESAADGLRSQNEATLAILQDIFSRLGPAPALNVQAPLHDTPIPATAGRKKISLKPSLPLDFDGECSAGKAFLTSCRTYIRLRSEVFNDDLVKVIWASDCHGFQNPCGLQVRVDGVWVRVGDTKPYIYPYPRNGLLGFSGFL